MPWNKIANIRGPKGDQGDPGAPGGGGVGGGVVGSIRLTLASRPDNPQPLLLTPDGNAGVAADGEWFDSDPAAPVFIGLHEQASAGEGLSYSDENNTLTYTRDGLFLHTLFLFVYPSITMMPGNEPWPYTSLEVFDSQWLAHQAFASGHGIDMTVSWLTFQSADDENYWAIQPVRSGRTLSIDRCFLTIAALA